MMGKLLIVLVALWANSGSVSSGGVKESPCPDLFQYESTDQPGQWTGTVTLLSDFQLTGLWARLLFDEKFSEVLVDDNLFQVDRSPDALQVLIKNRDFLLNAGAPTTVRITVKYDGNKVPSLIGYRLNAKTVCPEKDADPSAIFLGDAGNVDFISAILSSKKPIQEIQSCGTSLIKSEEIKNEKSLDGQWPWHVSISFRTNKTESKYSCAGTLISPRHVITAGHCVTYKNSEVPINHRKLSITLGKLIIPSDASTIKPDVNVNVKQIVLYPGYDANTLLNDLAILELEEPATISDNVKPVCLGPGVSDATPEGVLIGFGLNKDDKVTDLRQTRVKILQGEECAKKQSELPSLDNTLCASFTQDNPICIGDSGSGLVTFRAGSKPVWELNGVVTLGPALQNKFKCDRDGVVLLLADIARYRKWIQAVIS